jgi:hypothetical protein
VLTAQARIGQTLATPSVNFSDTSETPYDKIVVEFDQQTVINNANVTLESGGTLQNANDASSIAEYFTQTKAIIDSLLSTNAQALTLASYLLNPLPEPRFTSVSTTFASLTDAQKTALAPIEIGDTVSATKTFPSGNPISVQQNLAVEGIDHVINVNTGHRMTLWTSPTVIVYAFILDNTTLGVLDGLNVLG